MIINSLFSLRLTLSDDRNASLGNRSQLQNQGILTQPSALALLMMAMGKQMNADHKCDGQNSENGKYCFSQN